MWEFWIDRGGTFTDVIARYNSGPFLTRKVLSENPNLYKDPAVEAIRYFLSLEKNSQIPLRKIKSIRMGTTVATNALLERKGAQVVLVTTSGFRDQLRIAYQNRPNLFDRNIILPSKLYQEVLSVSERVRADGFVEKELNEDKLEADLRKLHNKGFKACAILFMHGYRFSEHEKRAAKIAKYVGFDQVSVSHEVSPLVKFVSRGDTTVLDAYLTPIIKKYVSGFLESFDGSPGEKLKFMKSDGGMTTFSNFRGKDAILSGPAGGVVGAVKTSLSENRTKIIGFDMGGTSTDVCHYSGSYERTFNSIIDGVRVTAPMMSIHTVAAGGGSLLKFDGVRMRVGPESSGANPGPVCYANDGVLSLTDANIVTGRLQPDFFPKVFGKEGNSGISSEKSFQAFKAISKNLDKSEEDVAEGFIRIAIDNMANAIKKISVEKGYDITEYCLSTFGGAGGQHACDIADVLGINECLIDKNASLLSALGMGLADSTSSKIKTIERELNEASFIEMAAELDNLSAIVSDELISQNFQEYSIQIENSLFLKIKGTDTPIKLKFMPINNLKKQFKADYEKLFGFKITDETLIIDSIISESVGVEKVVLNKKVEEKFSKNKSDNDKDIRKVFLKGSWVDAQFVNRENFKEDSTVQGPANIIEGHTSIFVSSGWEASITRNENIVLKRTSPIQRKKVSKKSDPIMLEIFNNLYMSIAEQMGVILEKTSQSVTIKERLDFSCAIFSSKGDLIANAPHMPVHLGSMSSSVKTVISQNPTIKYGDVFALNAPYNGGTHLPDVTVVSPVWDEKRKKINFFVASRGHHTDIGGTTPGSMPPDSRDIHQEGVYIDNFKLVSEGEFREKEVSEILRSAKYPVRSLSINLADLKAQIAACEKGINEINQMVSHFGIDVVEAYVNHVQNNAEMIVRKAVDKIHDSSFVYKMDPDIDGSERKIQVSIKVNKKSRSVIVDFSGTTRQLESNYNAPEPVTRAAVLYCFRLLAGGDIPMNEGVMRPINLNLPKGLMLSPEFPAAVIAGNVETSQAVTSCLLLALGIQAASQSTMNNTTWGNDKYQYYETICGGTGAGINFDGTSYEGTSGVHSHMTNSRLTDPEVLENRFPVVIEDFSIRENSSGKGQFNGGEGVIRKIRFLEKMTLAILSGHRVEPPPGLSGGGAGALGFSKVIRKNGKITVLGSADKISMEVGDVFWLETPGGGGLGKSK